MKITIDLNWIQSLYNMIKEPQYLIAVIVILNLGFGIIAQLLTIKRVKRYLRDKRNYEICGPFMVVHFIIQSVYGLSFWLVKVVALVLLYPVVSLALGFHFNPLEHIVVGCKRCIERCVIKKGEDLTESYFFDCFLSIVFLLIPMATLSWSLLIKYGNHN